MAVRFDDTHYGDSGDRIGETKVRLHAAKLVVEYHRPIRNGVWKIDDYIEAMDWVKLGDGVGRPIKVWDYLNNFWWTELDPDLIPGPRSEERRVGKECRSRWSPYQ